MKWITLIVTLILGGMLVYQLFFTKPQAGSPKAVSQAYLDAALAGDVRAIQSLCQPAAVPSALTVAASLRAAPAGADHVVFQNMETDPPRTGLTAMIGGRLMAIELEPGEGGWKIADVSIGDL
jgi:hypothetical protein